MESVEIDLGDSILRWHRVFELLSLERSISFFTDIGLNLSNIGSIQSVARSFMERYERRTGNETTDTILLQQTFIELACLTDHQTAQRLYDWGQEMFSNMGTTEGGAFIWGALLHRLVRLDGGKSDPVPPALSEHKVNAIVQILHHYLDDLPALEQQIENLERLPKSDFEKRIYRLYDKGCSPLDSLLDAVRNYRLRSIWNEIQELLCDDEKELFLQWGKSQAREMKIPLDLISSPF